MLVETPANPCQPVLAHKILDACPADAWHPMRNYLLLSRACSHASPCRYNALLTERGLGTPEAAQQVKAVRDAVNDWRSDDSLETVASITVQVRASLCTSHRANQRDGKLRQDRVLCERCFCSTPQESCSNASLLQPHFGMPTQT